MFTTLFVTTIFLSSLIISSLAVVSTLNPVFSVLFLILCFFNTSGVFLVLGLEFVPISFIVIYVGAIAVLFLFVIMMLNIKYSELQQQKGKTFVPLVFLALSLFFLECLVIFNCNSNSLLMQTDEVGFFAEFLNSVDNVMMFAELCCKQPNVSSLGGAIFVSHGYQLILSAFILLVAMVAAIILTLSKQFITKTQVIYLQVLSDHELSICY